MTFKRLDSTQATSSEMAANMCVFHARSGDKFRLCRIYEGLVNRDELNTRTVNELMIDYDIGEKGARGWQRGVKPAGWRLYEPSGDPDCTYDNVKLIMERYDISETTARNAIDLRKGSYMPRKSKAKKKVRKEVPELLYGMGTCPHTPSPLSPLLEGWER